MRASNNWLVWRYEVRKDSDKSTKVPYSPLDNYGIGTDEADRRRLTAYAATLQNRTESKTVTQIDPERGYDGIGFVFVSFNDKLCICGIDIDHQEPGGALMRDIIALFPNAYIERSPSGAGVHIALLVDVSRIPQITENGKQKLDKRFLQFLDLYMLRSQADGGNIKPGETRAGLAVSPNDSKEDITSPALSYGQLLCKALNVANGEKFTALFDRGDLSRFYGDDSGADMGLMNLLSF